MNTFRLFIHRVQHPQLHDECAFNALSLPKPENVAHRCLHAHHWRCAHTWIRIAYSAISERITKTASMLKKRWRSAQRQNASLPFNPDLSGVGPNWAGTSTSAIPLIQSECRLCFVDSVFRILWRMFCTPMFCSVKRFKKKTGVSEVKGF